MKKLLAITLALLLALTCAACTATDPENLFETAEATRGTTEPAPEETTAPTTTPVVPRNFPDVEPGYAYSNMQAGELPAGNFVDCGNELLFSWLVPDEGAFRTGNSVLMTLNKETGKISTFCKDATCNHETEKCAAAGTGTALEGYRGEIYGERIDRSTPNPDGVMVHEIMVLRNGAFESVLKGIRFYWHANGNLYVITSDSALAVVEEGRGTPRILVEEYTSYWNVMFGPYLYGVNMMGITRVDLSDPEPQVEVIVEAVGLVSRKIDGEFIYYTDEENILYRCNMDGSQPQKLYDQPVHLSGGCFDDQYLYFLLWEDWETWHMHGHHSGELYRMSKENPQEVALLCSFPEGVSIGLVHAVPGYDKLIVEADIGAFDENGDPISDPNSPDGLQGRIEELYLVDKAGGTIQKLEFPKF